MRPEGDRTLGLRRPRLLRGNGRESSAMDGSLTEQRRVSEEGFRIVSSVVEKEQV